PEIGVEVQQRDRRGIGLCVERQRATPDEQERSGLRAPLREREVRRVNTGARSTAEARRLQALYPPDRFSYPGSPGSTTRAVSPLMTTRGSTGRTSRPRAWVRTSSADPNSAS